MKKGFTLVELLSVIVILAVISLIATPKLVGVVETSRKSAKENSAKGYINSVNDQIVSNEFDEETSTIKDGTYYTALLKEVYKLKVSGEEPIEDSWVTIDNSTVTDYSLRFGDYIIDSTEPTFKVTDEKKIREHNMCIIMNAKRKNVRTIGDSYGCDMGDGTIRRFFYLSSDSTNLTLIMDKNLVEDVSNANIASKLSSATEEWNVTASIPTLEQINKDGKVHSFITKNLTTDIFWTTSGIVTGTGHSVTTSGTAGIRPIIQIAA